MQLKKITTAAAVTIFALGLSGCAKEGTDDLHSPGAATAAEWVELVGDPTPEIWEAGAGFVTIDDATDVFLSGSSSCPPVIAEATVTDDGDHNSLVVDLKKHSDTVCTDDYGFYGFKFNVAVSSVTVNDPNTDSQLKLNQFD